MTTKFKHHARRPRTVQSSYYAGDIAKLYNFPLATGEGQTIGIIELGGGYTLNDLYSYGNARGLPPINITAVSVDSGVNDPGDTSGANYEVLLDIELVYEVAPKAAIRVYFAPNTDGGFADAISQAIADKCNVISISWGASEDEWDSSSVAMFERVFQQAANAGITVLAAAGDSGYLDSPNTNNPTVDYPASSVWVLATGGTQITSSEETVWNNLDVGEGATGAGMSSLFSRPSWQTRDKIDKTNRCLPDIVGNASPLTGYNIYLNGSWSVVAGTSAVAPIYSGLIARINQLLGKNIGYAHPILYAINNRSYKDILHGNNGWWTAGEFFDLASGLGRLDGTNLVEDIKWAIDNAK